MSSLNDLVDPRASMELTEFEDLTAALRGVSGCKAQIESINQWADTAAEKLRARQEEHQEIIDRFMEKFRRESKRKSFELVDEDRRGTWKLASRKASARQVRDDDKFFSLIDEAGLFEEEKHTRVTLKWGELMKLVKWSGLEAYLKSTGDLIDESILRKVPGEGVTTSVSFVRSDERIAEEADETSDVDDPASSDDGSGLF